jgi:hypothetical protein
MSSESNEKYEGNSFEYRLKEVSDDEIISILRYRDHFQALAIKAAINEALRRGIINSVDDLQKEEFKPQEMPPKSLFPLGNNLAQNLLILRSLSRVFYGFGLIPIIYGYFQFREHNSNLGISAVLLGMLIIFVANRLEKKLKPIFAYIMLGMNFPAIGFAVHKLTSLGKPTAMDMFAAIIILMVLLYTTLYAHKIVDFIQKETSSERRRK